MTNKTKAFKSQMLSLAQLRRRTDPEALGFASTDALEPLAGMLGQDRAEAALAFGFDVNARGYNIFVMGSGGQGRHGALKSHVAALAEGKPTPSDWVYVTNFTTEHRPQYLELRPGEARKFSEALDKLITSVRETVAAGFEAPEYQSQRNAIEMASTQVRQALFNKVQGLAGEHSLAINQTPQGMSLVPVADGQALSSEAFAALDDEAREAFEESLTLVSGELKAVMEQMPKLAEEVIAELKKLDLDIIEKAVGRAVTRLRRQFRESDQARAHLNQVKKHMIKNGIALFQTNAQAAQVKAGQAAEPDLSFDIYRANTFIAADDTEVGAPVVIEDWPSPARLFGRIEHKAVMGALTTNFRMIKPGALHRANGGYLLVDIRRLFAYPMTWEMLKRALRSETIRIDAPQSEASTSAAVGLEPQPIPLDVKVVLFGDHQAYYQLASMDPDFNDLFKVVADFEDDLDRTPENEELYSRLLAGLCESKRLRPLTAEGCALMIETSAREMADQDKLSLRIAQLSDLLREADWQAAQSKSPSISASHISAARRAREHRLSRIQEKMQEQVLRQSVNIQTSGTEIGRINGLAVLGIGGYSFGKPSAISIKTRIGRGQLVNIEREASLSGPLHTKGVHILTGYLQSKFALDYPLSLDATIAFEQSYGGVDGDSASSTELYALLSSLSGTAINQGIAVTGSVDQDGRVQAIGGAVEKIEGFFDICSERGLNGDQGCILPAANVKNLMLKQEILEACEAGKFHVWAVDHIDQGLEILTGVAASEINAKADAQLVAWAERMVELQKR